MSCDRFIHFKNKAPSKEEIEKVLEDYLGAFLVNNEWDGNRWNVTLVGNNSWPFRRMAIPGAATAGAEENAKYVRWMEVYIGDDNIDVITRQGDWATNCLADGFAKLVAQFWKGELELEG